MRKLLFILTTLLGAATACSSHNKQSTMQQQTTNDSPKIVVAFFSATGTTEAVAKQIAEATGGTLYNIAPKQPYTAADLDWHNSRSRSSVEMNDTASRPELADHNAPIADADVVLVGFPIWWYTCPTIINTFFETYDFKGKRVGVFCTSGGSTVDKAAADLAARYKGIEWLPAATLNSQRSVTQWLDTISLRK